MDNSEKRQEVRINPEELTKQRYFIEEIKHINSNEEMRTLQKRRYFIQTYGCQMNENDSERLAGFISEMGYVEAHDEGEADLIVYNTCCVRENAELKVYGHLGALKGLKRNKPGMIIAVCGCMMQQPEVVDHINRKYSHVDLIFGTHNLYKFPEILYGVITAGKRITEVWENAGTIAEGLPIERKEGVKAWVTVMYGCNNFCSYCIVPYVRGRERSRKVEDIAEEVDTLGKQGFKEVTLLGQNVNSYGKDMPGGMDFAGLLKEINSISGIERIRFLTSHPKDLSDELIYAVRDLDKVCEHIHLPIQSGSSRILSAMNRKYTKEQYLKLAEKIRNNIPGIALTTDIIVGFPGETEEDFLDTLDVVEKVRFDTAFTFLYSKRTGTPAAKSAEQIPEEVKKERFERLLDLQNRISKEVNDKLLGHEEEVLVEGLSRNSTNTFTGRTRTNKIINFEGDKDLVGRIVRVKISRIRTWSLEGSITE